MGNIVWSADRGWHAGPPATIGLDGAGRIRIVRDARGTLARAKARRRRRCLAYAGAYVDGGSRAAAVELRLALEADRLVITLQERVLRSYTVGGVS